MNMTETESKLARAIARRHIAIKRMRELEEFRAYVESQTTLCRLHEFSDRTLARAICRFSAELASSAIGELAERASARRSAILTF